MSVFRSQPLSPSIKTLAWEKQLIAFVYTDYHREIVGAMLAAGRACLESYNHSCAQNALLLCAPGAFELPYVTQQLLLKRPDVTGVVTLGAVVRGETPHFEYVSQSVSHGIMQVSLTHKTPVTFGVLTVDTLEQAHARAKGGNNKGQEATVALLELLALHDQLGLS